MMLRHVFPLERCYPIATFPRLSLQTAHTATYKDIKANLLGKWVLQAGKARLWVQ